jgi:predicted MPP superfamily phosphohydrolase
MLFEAQWLQLRHLKLTLPGLPLALAGLRLLHVSDLHTGSPWPNELAIAKLEPLARETAPDLVLFTGDMTDKKKALEPCLEMLSHIRAPLGKFAVLGNHDHGLRKNALHEFSFGLIGQRIARNADMGADEVAATVSLNRDLLGHAGITLLENECAGVERDGDRLQVCGIDELEYGLADMAAVRERLDSSAGLRILLSHSPDVISQIRPGEFHLVLSGHTHGGQICMPHPWKGRILLSSSGSSYRYGLYQHGGTLMHVSRGVGTTFVPLRLLSRPEVTLLELVPG